MPSPGPDLAQRLAALSGAYALALPDGDALWLQRDASGLQPLYVAEEAGALAWSASLADFGGRAISRPALHEYLRFGDIAPPRTLREGVVAPPPGQALRWRPAQGFEPVPAPPLASPAPATFEDALERLDGLLRQAIAQQLQAARRPAAFLSGGVDSALLCALAARERPDLVALTVGFEGERYDEAPAAAALARHFGLRHEVLRFARPQLAAALQRLAREADQPAADPALPATLLAFEHARREHDLVLDGTGADEALGLMPPRHVRLATGWASLLPAPLRRLGVRALRAHAALAPYAPILDFEHPAELLIRWQGYTRAEVARLTGDEVSFADSSFFRTYARFARRAHFERASALLDAMPLDRLAQAGALTGLAAGYPYTDPPTNRFLRQLRTEWRWSPGQPKRILRALLARYAPAALWDRPKHGFDFPLAAFLAGDGFGLVHAAVAGTRWRRSGLLVPAEVERWVQRFVGGDAAAAFRVWTLVLLLGWLEHHDC